MSSVRPAAQFLVFFVVLFVVAGCAFFWPFDLTRYFLPWRPIPVAPPPAFAAWGDLHL